MARTTTSMDEYDDHHYHHPDFHFTLQYTMADQGLAPEQAMNRQTATLKPTPRTQRSTGTRSHNPYHSQHPIRSSQAQTQTQTQTQPAGDNSGHVTYESEMAIRPIQDLKSKIGNKLHRNGLGTDNNKDNSQVTDMGAGVGTGGGPRRALLPASRMSLDEIRYWERRAEEGARTMPKADENGHCEV